MPTKRADLAERREEIRDRIRTAAIAEFAENGLAGASTQGIADRAGITKTRLHYYITSKEGLYKEALEHVTNAWVDLFDGIRHTDCPRAFIASYVDRKVRFCMANPDSVRLFVSEVMRGGPMLVERFHRSRETMRKAADLLRGWAAAGLIRRMDPVLFQFHVWAMTEHYAVRQMEIRFMLGLDQLDPIDVDAVVDEMTRFVAGGLGIGERGGA
jgi:AcrR family transcriptional regulator